MNKITFLAAFTGLSLMAMPLYADDAHHPEKAQKAAGGKTATKPAESEMAAEKRVKPAQDIMRKLQDQMEKIRKTDDPQERQRLMQEHMQTMKEGMKELRGMGGMKMMDMGKGGKQGGMMMGMGEGGKKGGMMMGGDMMKMHDMMEMRMEMMEMMMDQMMQREEVREAMPK